MVLNQSSFVYIRIYSKIIHHKYFSIIQWIQNMCSVISSGVREIQPSNNKIETWGHKIQNRVTGRHSVHLDCSRHWLLWVYLQDMVHGSLFKSDIESADKNHCRWLIRDTLCLIGTFGGSTTKQRRNSKHRRCVACVTVKNHNLELFLKSYYEMLLLFKCLFRFSIKPFCSYNVVITVILNV